MPELPDITVYIEALESRIVGQTLEREYTALELLKPQVGGDSQAFFESQQLPPDKRGVSFEALFYRQLSHVTTKIHETENIDQIMLESSQDICKLFNADRLTLYAVNDDRTAIVSKIKTGLNASKDLKLPITPQSLAGYAACREDRARSAPDPCCVPSSVHWLLPRLRVWLGLGLRRLAEGLLGGKAKAGHRF